MGLLKNLILGVAGAKTYQSVFNKPIVTPPPGYVIRGMKQKGVGSSWVITYSKKNSMNLKSTFRVNPNIKAMNVGGAKFQVDWP